MILHFSPMFCPQQGLINGKIMPVISLNLLMCFKSILGG